MALRPGSIVLPGPLEPPAPAAGAPGSVDQWPAPEPTPGPIAMGAGPDGDSGGTGSTGDSGAPRPAPRPAPDPGLDPGAFAGTVINEAAVQVAVVVKPAAAAAVATTFTLGFADLTGLGWLFGQRTTQASRQTQAIGRKSKPGFPAAA